MEDKPIKPDSAISVMVKNIPVFRATLTVEETMGHLAKEGWDDIHSIYVVSDERVLEGVVPLQKILSSDKKNTLSKLMEKPKIVMGQKTDQEKIAIEALKNDLKSVPVVDEKGVLLGAVGADQIIDILHEEHLEDFLRSSGISGKGSKIIKLVTEGLFETVKARIPWLMVGLTGGLIASFVVSRFEGSLERNVALAFFISMIAYMSDAIGTQTETIFIRSLTLMKFNIMNYILREFLVGASIGSFFGLLTAVFGLIISGSASIGLVVGLSLFLSMSLATVLACVTPIILRTLGKDPAVGSGPFTTAIQDLISLMIYFSIASWVLSQF